MLKLPGGDKLELVQDWLTDRALARCNGNKIRRSPAAGRQPQDGGTPAEGTRSYRRWSWTPNWHVAVRP